MHCYNVDRASLYAFSPILTFGQDIGKDTGGRGGGGDSDSPTWLRRSWYILLLQIACELPYLLLLNVDLLSRSLQAKGMLYHSDLKTLRLAAWKLSSRPSRVLAFQEVIGTALACTRPTSRQVYDGRWRAFVD